MLNWDYPYQNKKRCRGHLACTRSPRCPREGRKGRTRESPRVMWYSRERHQLLLMQCQALQIRCETIRDVLLTNMLWVTNRWRREKNIGTEIRSPKVGRKTLRQKARSAFRRVRGPRAWSSLLSRSSVC